ncbi:hypothetical protein LPJ59_002357, partial [Coemansia sp. RSA 2399]
MVSFVCNYCQDTLKKAKLDIHAQRCRNASFSCIDCGVDFEGTLYRQHTSCMTESEKYEGKNKPKKQQQKNSSTALQTTSSTVDQLTKKAQAIEADTNTSSSKKRKAEDGETKKETRIKNSSNAEWDSTKLPTDPVDALVSAIAYTVQTQKPGDASFKRLKKQSMELVVNHPKSKLSESDAKK